MRLYFIVLAAKPKSPERPTAEEAALERARKIAQERRKLPPGDPPVFKLRLPKVVELEEGDRLRLECRAEGTPEPMGKYWSKYKPLSFSTTCMANPITRYFSKYMYYVLAYGLDSYLAILILTILIAVLEHLGKNKYFLCCVVLIFVTVVMRSILAIIFTGLVINRILFHLYKKINI